LHPHVAFPLELSIRLGPSPHIFRSRLASVDQDGHYGSSRL
jgi:hypothetical protein